jgi:hypothetical protein
MMCSVPSLESVLIVFEKQAYVDGLILPQNVVLF